MASKVRSYSDGSSCSKEVLGRLDFLFLPFLTGYLLLPQEASETAAFAFFKPLTHSTTACLESFEADYHTPRLESSTIAYLSLALVLGVPWFTSPETENPLI